MQSLEPHYSTAENGEVLVLESFAGPRRREAVEQWLREAEEAGARTWRLRCAPGEGGVWAGLAELVESLVSDVEKAVPEMLHDHGYEISLILPHRQDELDVARSLTDTAEAGEQTRSFAADRAYRSVHGLIDLVSAWYPHTDGRPWAIACEDYDLANGLVWRFFRELVRRRGQMLRLHLLLAVEPSRAGDVVADFEPTAVPRRCRVGGEVAPTVERDPEEMTRRALALEAEVKGREEAERYVDLPRLVHYWLHSTTPEKALRWQLAAMSILNHRGLYEASLEMADDVEAYLLRGSEGEDAERYGLAVYAFYFCLVPLNFVERARRVIEEVLPHVPRLFLPGVWYLVSMFYARFLEEVNLEVAEDYLQRALALVSELDLPDHEREFQTVFLMNGLALVRVRQRRPQEALELCREGIARLDERLQPSQHQLHRSVLVYNIAQVYAQIGPFDRALETFAQAIEMDPNFSEYHNERGAVFFKLERYEEAEQDYLAAIELRPPYPEVWVNLGQCYRAMDRMPEAVSAYSRAIDLDPTPGLAWAGRADAYASLGDVDAALADYRKALEVDDSDALVWAGQAVLKYEQGEVREALSDLDHAVEIAPDLGELRQNRAVARQDLGLIAEAASDLQSYLELCPDAEDHADVAEQLQELLVAAGEPAR